MGTFWRQHPALLYALTVLVALAASTNGCWWLCLVWIPFCLPAIFEPPLSEDNLRLKMWLTLPVFVAAAVYGIVQHKLPDTPKGGLRGSAHFEINSVRRVRGHFGAAHIYRGVLRSFVTGADHRLRGWNIPCTVYIPRKYKRPPADRAYVVEGVLKPTSAASFALKIKPNAPWRVVEGSRSIAELRYQYKKGFGEYLQRKVSQKRSAAFLCGLATGDFSDKMLQFEFGRLGLQHIMAISGFHFSIVAGVLSLFLRILLPQKTAAAALIFCLASYFLFIGPTPSIQRAWIVVTLYFLGKIIERPSTALNSLGFAMLVMLLLNPLSFQSIGFQFSFLATSGILIFHPSINLVLQKVLLKRSLSTMVAMNRLDQGGYIFLSLFREALSLSLAVHLAVVPLMLFHFHRFPLLGLVYNLFFPFLVSMSLLFLILALLTTPLPFISGLLYKFNGAYTQLLLDMTSNVPETLNLVLRSRSLPLPLLLAYLTLYLFVGILAKSATDKYMRDKQDWAFV